MALIAAALMALPTAGLGAPFPAAALSSAPTRHQCYTRYGLTTGAPLAEVADFYRAEASQAGAALLDDSGAKFTGYRTLAFVTQPKYMFVVLDRKGAATRISVTFKVGAGCSGRS